MQDGTSADDLSVAVLAFDNLCNDQEQGYLADGLAEALTTDLSKIIGLRIAFCSSSFYYKGK